MRVILFQPRFHELIESGSKTTTIRKRSWGVWPGVTLSLRAWLDKPYRSKQRELREARCKAVSSIIIETDRPAIYLTREEQVEITDRDELEKIAVNDGFASFSDMQAWFVEHHHRGSFQGYLIEWE